MGSGSVGSNSTVGERVTDVHPASGKGLTHAEAVPLAVLEVEEDADLLVRRDLAVLTPVVMRSAGEDELLLDAEVVGLQECRSVTCC